MNKNNEYENFINFVQSPANNISFTKREMECLSYLFDGLTHKRIAKTLSLSHRTVEAYVKNMRQKAQAKSTKELLEIAEKMGIKRG